MATTKTVTLKCTINYKQFRSTKENRTLDLKKHKNLYASMKRYGFLKTSPIAVFKNCQGYIVKDGQHRLAIAEELGLPVYYIESDVDFDVAEINCAQMGWTVKDYADKWANCGKEDYQRGIEFADRHGLPLGTACAILSGSGSFSQIKKKFELGEFKIRNEQQGEVVATIYTSMSLLSKAIRCARFAEALILVARVDGFDPQRMIDTASKQREKLIPYSTRDAYLGMLEEIYNFRRSQKVPLKFEALMTINKNSSDKD